MLSEAKQSLSPTRNRMLDMHVPDRSCGLGQRLEHPPCLYCTMAAQATTAFGMIYQIERNMRIKVHSTCGYIVFQGAMTTALERQS